MVKFIPWTDYHTKDTAFNLDEEVNYGVWIPHVDEGYWATDTKVSNILVWTDVRPVWATHIAWIEA